MTETYINANQKLENIIDDQLVKHQVYKNHEIYAKQTSLMVNDHNQVEHHVYDVYVSVNPLDNYGREILSGKLDGYHSPNIDLMDVSFVGSIRLDGELLPGKYIGFTSTDTYDYSLESCMEMAFSAVDNILLPK